MAITQEQTQRLCRFAGVQPTDAQAVEVLTACWEQAKQWYKDAGCNPEASGIETWYMHLASWFYDNRGRDGADLPPLIVKSVHHFR